MSLYDLLLNNLQANSDLLNFVAILCTAILSFYTFRKEISISFIKEQYENVIFPLFSLLEPVLYQEVQPEYLDKALQIIELNKNLADGRLLELSYYCSQNPSQQNFNHLCSYVDKLYDKTCRRLGLKRRRFSYRIARHQYKHWSYFLFYVLVLTFLWTITLVASLFVFLVFVSYLYLIYQDANDTNKLISLLLGTIFMLAVLKYMEKHF